MPDDPFQIPIPPHASLHRAALTAARPVLSWLLRLDTYRDLYRHARDLPGDAPFEARALDTLDIQPVCPESDLAPVPVRGPLVIASNHPQGALDGLLLASVLRRARPDVRVLTNHLLSRIPELAALCFFVDPFGGSAGIARSQAGLRAAHLWLKSGGALVVFPAGEVAHERRVDGSRADSPWHSTAGRLVLATGARVVPAYISGANTHGFYAAGRIHSRLRTALLARELLRARGRRVIVRLGLPLSPQQLPATGGAAAATGRMREAMESLAPGARPMASGPGGSSDVAADVARLPDASLLLESGQFQVFCAEAPQIPSALREIGRLREVTYRAVGEGTGRSLDLDRFDDRYLHLFSWDRDRRCVVGAYRIGRTDRIMAATGVEGLYTRTLFRYDDRLLSRLAPSLELGRSFVRAEYQKTYNALLLLWRGIGQFVVRHPEYRVLFGPVSISPAYSASSHRMLMAFLRQHHLDRELTSLVDAVHPCSLPPGPVLVSDIPHSIDEANRVMTAVDGRGVPILLQQYLKLNARLLGFNVDPAFSGALDALMMVDLARVEPHILGRYLGRRQAVQFLGRHRGFQPAQTPWPGSATAVGTLSVAS